MPVPPTAGRRPQGARRTAAALALLATSVAAAAWHGRPVPDAFAADAGRSPTMDDDCAAACDTTRVVLVGRVQDDRGTPLDGAAIVVELVGRRRRQTVTAAGGRFTLALPADARGAQARVTARRTGHASATVAVHLAGDTVRVALVLRAAMAGPDSSAVADARATSASVAAAEVAAAPPPAPPPPPIAVRQALAAGQAMRLRGMTKLAAPMDAAPRAPRPGEGAPRDTLALDRTTPPTDRERYAPIDDNPFLAVGGNPRSTFSVDVDRAAYGNLRRFLAQGTRPPADAVRLEELVNYFPYRLPAPTGDAPLAIHTEVTAAPWRPAHRLVRIALQARPLDVAQLPPHNLVFLVDVSGSMMSPDKLPLAKQALRLLIDQLRPQDRVALVAYAGSAGLVLPSTPGSEKARIAEALDRLEAGGSTAGGAGLQLAYRLAREHLAPGGNNRVVLATDGDFNVGVSSDGELKRLIERERASGVQLSVLGFGTGNYADATMKTLAKHGDGNYAYVDRLDEARKVLVGELGATLVTVARDVKLQVEFNPALVRGYRLLGYEGRLLRDEDFRDDAKDAGDVGAGHTVTALYEVIPTDARTTTPLRGTDPLRYGGAAATTSGAHGGELLHVALRWKRPGETRSRLLEHAVPAAAPRGAGSDDQRFAAAVAAFGMLLRESPYRGSASAEQVLTLARGARGDDPGGYRREFERLVERWRTIGDARADDVAGR